MYNIYNSIFLNDQEGIQGFKIFYDTLFLNVKVKNGSEYLNMLIVEPFRYDFTSESFIPNNGGIVINFGNTNKSEPLLSEGNTFITVELDEANKIVYIIGLSTVDSRTIPVIYCYDLNQRGLLKIFPTSAQMSEWSAFTNFTYNSTQIPFIKKDKTLMIGFKSFNGDQNYLNIIEIYLNKTEARIKNYEMIEIPDIDFIGMNNRGVVYKMDNAYGVLDYK